jgi:uncharacterized protein (DUF302 family)
MRNFIVVLASMFMLSVPAFAGDALVTKASAHGVAVTVDRLEAVLKEKGIAVMARIDHAAGAKKADMTLRPLQVLIFGSPKLGTPLMQSNPRIGLDLPLKVVVWEDEAGRVWLGYTAPKDLVARYQIGDRAEVMQKMTAVLDQVTAQAIAR